MLAVLSFQTRLFEENLGRQLRAIFLTGCNGERNAERLSSSVQLSESSLRLANQQCGFRGFGSPFGNVLKTIERVFKILGPIPRQTGIQRCRTRQRGIRKSRKNLVIERGRLRIVLLPKSNRSRLRQRDWPSPSLLISRLPEKI